jgi:hypothetical protein
MSTRPKLFSDPHFQAALRAFETDEVTSLRYAAECILGGLKLTNNSLHDLPDLQNASITALALGYELASIYPPPKSTREPETTA